MLSGPEPGKFIDQDRRSVYMQTGQYRFHTLPALILFLCMAVFCVVSAQPAEMSGEITNPEISPADSGKTDLSWTKVPMTDAVTGEQFTIDEVVQEGKPVIIHTFAVWCSACQMQLRETERLVAEDPDGFSVIGIDIDPNENQDMVRRHIEKNEFPGRYAASPKELSRGLVSTFGTGFLLELPNTIIICNKTVTRIGSEGGLFRGTTIRDALSHLCR